MALTTKQKFQDFKDDQVAHLDYICMRYICYFRSTKGGTKGSTEGRLINMTYNALLQSNIFPEEWKEAIYEQPGRWRPEAVAKFSRYPSLFSKTKTPSGKKMEVFDKEHEIARDSVLERPLPFLRKEVLGWLEEQKEEATKLCASSFKAGDEETSALYEEEGVHLAHTISAIKDRFDKLHVSLEESE